MSGITTHVLDTARGRPAARVSVILENRAADGAWVKVGSGATDADGRLRNLTEGKHLEPGVFRLTFDTQSYFRGLRVDAFFPEVSITFEIEDPSEHYHVPLLLSPFGYSTYRGS